MVRVAPVQLQYNPKTLWFDPTDLELFEGARVIVRTERGTEYGVCAGGVIEVDEEEVGALKSPLKPVVRIASEEDIDQVELMRQQSEEALPIFKKLAAETNEDMHPVMVEYLFDGDRAVFFFESEERVDFRDLVRRLASELKVRVDMRQIGVRDEARMVGGLGHCGQELCCKRLGGEFNPVSIRMAKEQDLSLNPTKISGVCGRLMCCLRYEFDAYKDFKSRAPKQGAKVETPAGVAKVVDLNVPKETVTVLLEEDKKRVTFPLSAMDEPADGEKRPRSIGEAFEEYANPDPFATSTVLGMFDTAGFTQEDKLGTPEARHNAKRSDKGAEDGDGEAKKGSRRRRRRKGSGGKSQDQAKQQPQNASEGAEKQGTSRKRRRRSSQGKLADSPGAVRPGQKSSGLSESSASSGPSKQERASSAHRTSRRRSHKTGSGASES